MNAFEQMLRDEKWRKRLARAGYKTNDAPVERKRRYPPGHVAHLVPALNGSRKDNES